MSRSLPRFGPRRLPQCFRPLRAAGARAPWATMAPAAEREPLDRIPAPDAAWGTPGMGGRTPSSAKTGRATRAGGDVGQRNFGVSPR